VAGSERAGEKRERYTSLFQAEGSSALQEKENWTTNLSGRAVPQTDTGASGTKRHDRALPHRNIALFHNKGIFDKEGDREIEAFRQRKAVQEIRRALSQQKEERDYCKVTNRS
jgi:hypothetical protein